MGSVKQNRFYKSVYVLFHKSIEKWFISILFLQACNHKYIGTYLLHITILQRGSLKYLLTYIVSKLATQ
jgi:hypothetical protein